MSDDQREVLRDVWTWLIASAGEGQGVQAGFKIHSFALQLCFPRAGRWTTTKPTAYQRYAHEPALRPWATDGEKQLVFVILSSMEWNDRANTWTLKRPIAEFANQIGCGRTRINDALNCHRDSEFPIVAIDNSPAFEKGGQRYRGALTFSLVRDPFKFAEARDRARSERLTAAEERRKALHVDVVKLQIARDRGEITPREFATRKALLTHQIRWGSTDAPAPLVAVDAIQPPAGAQTSIDGPTPTPAPILRAKERREAFATIEAVYPKEAEHEADRRVRARERWEMLAPTQALTDAIVSDVSRRTSTPRHDNPHGWGGVDPRYVPDLLTYFRDELWTVTW